MRGGSEERDTRRGSRVARSASKSRTSERGSEQRSSGVAKIVRPRVEEACPGSEIAEEPVSGGEGMGTGVVASTEETVEGFTELFLEAFIVGFVSGLGEGKGLGRCRPSRGRGVG
jgi:hypothetical protein